MSLGVGDRAPDFSLPGTGGRDYSLSEFSGRPVVLVFYPGDDTPVCTKQLSSYNDDLAQFSEMNAQVIGTRFSDTIGESAEITSIPTSSSAVFTSYTIEGLVITR